MRRIVRPLPDDGGRSTGDHGPDAGSNPKICDFLRKYGLQSSLVVRFFDAARDGGVLPFGILAGRPAGQIRLGGHAFDALTALIEASRAVVSKDQLFEPRLARHDRRQAPAVERKIAALRKGL